jgi:hypothetical protein
MPDSQIIIPEKVLRINLIPCPFSIFCENREGEKNNAIPQALPSPF